MLFTSEDIIKTGIKIFRFKSIVDWVFGNYKLLLTDNQRMKFKTIMNEIRKCERIETPSTCSWVGLKVPFKDWQWGLSYNFDDLVFQTPTDGNNKFGYNSKNPRKKLCEHWIDSLGIEQEYMTTLINVFIDIILYSLKNNETIELKKLGMITKEQWKQILKAKSFTTKDLEDAKMKLKEAMPDGYIKDIYLKAINKEIEESKIKYTYSTIDIINLMK